MKRLTQIYKLALIFIKKFRLQNLVNCAIKSKILIKKPKKSQEYNPKIDQLAS